MEITFKNTVKNQILKLIENDSRAKLVLDFDHSLARENVGSDCCGVTRYRTVITDSLPGRPAFDGIINSNLGPVYFKKWGAMYLDEKMTIDRNGCGFIQIQGNGALIAENSEIVDYRK
jgi:uncharacterized protein YqkB